MSEPKWTKGEARVSINLGNYIQWPDGTNSWMPDEATAQVCSASPALAEALDEVEWCGTPAQVDANTWVLTCPSCEETRPKHSSDCSLDAALALARGEG